MNGEVEQLGVTLQRHRALKRAVEPFYSVPGVKTLARVGVRFAIQHFPIRLKNRQRLYNFFAPNTVPDRPIECENRISPNSSVRLELDLNDDLSRVWYFWGYTGYEASTVRLFRKLLETKSCVFDIGANIGYYSLLAATLLRESGEVHAFEPAPRIFQWLARNAELNHFSCLRLNRVALSETNGTLPLFLPADAAGTNASLIEQFTNQDSSVMVQAMRFDSYCAAKVDRPVDLIKLDVEGAELSVLCGAEALIDKWLPDIICEVLEPFDRDLSVFFSSWPYRKFLITDAGLEEQESLRAHPSFRDYYLSVCPPKDVPIAKKQKSGVVPQSLSHA